MKGVDGVVKDAGSQKTKSLRRCQRLKWGNYKANMERDKTTWFGERRLQSLQAKVGNQPTKCSEQEC